MRLLDILHEIGTSYKASGYLSNYDFENEGLEFTLPEAFIEALKGELIQESSIWNKQLTLDDFRNRVTFQMHGIKYTTTEDELWTDGPTEMFHEHLLKLIGTK